MVSLNSEFAQGMSDKLQFVVNELDRLRFMP